MFPSTNSLNVHFQPLVKVIMWVTGVLRRTAVGDWIDSDDGFRTGSRNVTRQQQSFSGLQSPGWSFSIEVCYSWVQTIFLFTVVKVLNGSHTWVVTPFEWNFSMVTKINAFKKTNSYASFTRNLSVHWIHCLSSTAQTGWPRSGLKLDKGFKFGRNGFQNSLKFYHGKIQLLSFLA